MKHLLFHKERQKHCLHCTVLYVILSHDCHDQLQHLNRTSLCLAKSEPHVLGNVLSLISKVQQHHQFETETEVLFRLVFSYLIDPYKLRSAYAVPRLVLK